MQFTKMQATGNDFIILEKDNVVGDVKELALKMCDRHFGIGADGIILVDTSVQPLYMRIFNADGSEAGICGNGLRCFTKYVFDNGLAKDYDIKINTPSGTKRITVNLERGEVVSARVNMGPPSFSASDIPVNITNGAFCSGVITDYPLEVSGIKLLLTFINMGNPHSINFISSDVFDFPLNEIGPLVEHDALFPERTNFEIARIIDRNTIRARVWERGVGETLACGSGACAIAVAASTKNLTSNKVDIILPGGKLIVEWDINGDVYLTGTVETVFTGEWTK